jgi:methenyltetrahydromethanopterin cyclohydrolase
MADSLNAAAAALLDTARTDFNALRIDVLRCESGAEILDFGARARGGLRAGKLLARVCAAGLAEVELEPADSTLPADWEVVFQTDAPVRACLASQYAGRQVAEGKFFAMGSGPMRAAAGGEELFDHIGNTETAEHVVGVLETAQTPPPEVCRRLAELCNVSSERLTLAIARTASIAGSVQVVARSVETALHKLHELGFDVGRVVSGAGRAPVGRTANQRSNVTDPLAARR